MEQQEEEEEAADPRGSVEQRQRDRDEEGERHDHCGQIHGVCFAPDGMLFSVDGMIFEWNFMGPNDFNGILRKSSSFSAMRPIFPIMSYSQIRFLSL